MQALDPTQGQNVQMSSKKPPCSCYTAVLPVIDLHPAEPLLETKYGGYNLVRKQCMRLSVCASIPTQAFPGADRSLNYHTLCNMAQSMSLK